MPRPEARALRTRCRPVLLEGRRNRRERGIQVGAETQDGGDDRNRNAGRDEAVLDRRGAAVVLQKAQNKRRHRKSSILTTQFYGTDYFAPLKQLIRTFTKKIERIVDYAAVTL